MMKEEYYFNITDRIDSALVGGSPLDSVSDDDLIRECCNRGILTPRTIVKLLRDKGWEVICKRTEEL